MLQPISAAVIVTLNYIASLRRQPYSSLKRVRIKKTLNPTYTVRPPSLKKPFFTRDSAAALAALKPLKYQIRNLVHSLSCSRRPPQPERPQAAEVGALQLAGPLGPDMTLRVGV